MDGYLHEISAAPIISGEAFAEYRLSQWPSSPRRVLSGMIGAWCAWAMGAKVVILAGMDGFGGTAGAMKDARIVAERIKCPVRVVGGGPLAEVFAPYDPKERFGKYTPHAALEVLRGTAGEITVKVRCASEIDGRPVKPGDTWIGPHHAVARLLKHNVVEVL